MLPSMPILFTRDSQDAFGNKVEPSTSFFNQNCAPKLIIKPQPPPQKVAPEVAKVAQRETKNKTNSKKKDDPPKNNDNVLETALVRSYYAKVQSRFSSNTSVPTNKFVQFQNILKSFNPHQEKPVELYRSIEGLFGDDHKDIVEEFLLFLKPGQAAEVGRFMDRLMLVHMTGFIELLQSTFSRKPTVLRKVLRAISTGISSGCGRQMKTRVLPHLRSSPRLTQMFKTLFPDERPPDSLYEPGTDIMHESILTGDKGYDVWELEEESDNKRKPDAKEGLDTVYLHGRVFLQHGRLLRSARVTFPYSKEPYRVHARRLAAPPTPAGPPPAGPPSAGPPPRLPDPKRTRTDTKIPPKKPKKQLKSPTKHAKDVNDNTKHRDCAVDAMSPKAKKTQPNNRTKTCKREEKLDNSKRERKDGKNQFLKRDDGSRAKQAKNEVVSIEPTVNTRVQETIVESKIDINNSWTRDEDKTMLQVLKGEASSEQVFGRIRELLPHRSTTEIKERFCHVMTLLQQMAVGEVT